MSAPEACGLVASSLNVVNGCALGEGDRYYPAVVRRGSDEGTYGWSSLKDARPAATLTCP
jgi:hypothetical protein